MSRRLVDTGQKWSQTATADSLEVCDGVLKSSTKTARLLASTRIYFFFRMKYFFFFKFQVSKKGAGDLKGPSTGHSRPLDWTLERMMIMLRHHLIRKWKREIHWEFFFHLCSPSCLTQMPTIAAAHNRSPQKLIEMNGNESRGPPLPTCPV